MSFLIIFQNILSDYIYMCRSFFMHRQVKRRPDPCKVHDLQHFAFFNPPVPLGDMNDTIAMRQKAYKTGLPVKWKSLVLVNPYRNMILAVRMRLQVHPCYGLLFYKTMCY